MSVVNLRSVDSSSRCPVGPAVADMSAPIVNSLERRPWRPFGVMISSTTSVISAPIWRPRLPPAIRKIAGGLQAPSARRAVTTPSPAVPPIRTAPFTTPGNTATRVGPGQGLARDAVAVGHVDHLVERRRRPREAGGELRALGVGADGGPDDERGQDGETEAVPALGAHGVPSRENRGPAGSGARRAFLTPCCPRRARRPKLFVGGSIMGTRAPAGRRPARGHDAMPTPEPGPPTNFIRTAIQEDRADRALGWARRHAIPARAQRLPPHRPRQGDLDRLRPRPGIRRDVPPPLRRHQPRQGGGRVRRSDPGGHPLARLRLGSAPLLRLRLLRAALPVGGGADPPRPGLRRRPLGRGDPAATGAR